MADSEGFFCYSPLMLSVNKRGDLLWINTRFIFLSSLLSCLQSFSCCSLSFREYG
nr:MAG TPA: hypothetical protein [Caudoviricetes sp.]